MLYLFLSISWLHNPRAWFGNSSLELFCIAVDKAGLAMTVVNIWNQKKLPMKINVYCMSIRSPKFLKKKEIE